MLRGVASLVAGFLLLPGLVRLGLAAALSMWPSAPYMILTLCLAVLAAGLAAVVTASLAPEPPFLWVLLLAFVVFTGGLVFGIQRTGGPSPTWYLLALPLSTGLGIGVGGWAFLEWRDRRA